MDIKINHKTTRKELELAFKELKPIEEQARDQYKELASQLKDKEIIDILLFISGQEQKHADLVQEMIEIIEKGNKKTKLNYL